MSGFKLVVVIGTWNHSEALLRLMWKECRSGKIAMVSAKGEPVDLQTRRIEISDEILVANFGGKISEQMRQHIQYAESIGKEIRWVEGDEKIFGTQPEPA